MRVAVLVLPASRPFDVVAALETFSDDRVGRIPRNEVARHSPWSRVALSGGIEMSARPMDEALAADVLVVPGFVSVDEAFSDDPVSGVGDAIDLVRAVHRRGGTVAALCTGAFLVARSGLLDAQVATTHWRFEALLRQRFPRLRVDADRIFAHDVTGRVWTSAGVTAGIDLCVELIRSQHGSVAAAEVARSMVMPVVRGGGQRQFIPPRSGVGDGIGGVVSSLSVEVAAAIGGQWTVASLAARAAVSPRTLHRVFVETVGAPPIDWLCGMRVDAARELLESSSLSVEQIAHRVGFSSATVLRRHFARRLGVSPSSYRERFSRPPSS